jgi:predicted ATP-dependent Lon-type protease
MTISGQTPAVSVLIGTLSAFDVNLQVMSLMQGRDTGDLGVAMFIALVWALAARPIAAGVVVLGQMSIHGVLSRVEGLADKLRIALDAGARRVLIPTEILTFRNSGSTFVAGSTEETSTIRRPAGPNVKSLLPMARSA